MKLMNLQCRQGNGEVTLSITFSTVGEVCITAAVNEGGSDYGAYEFFVFVEPETGDADLYFFGHGERSSSSWSRYHSRF